MKFFEVSPNINSFSPAANLVPIFDCGVFRLSSGSGRELFSSSLFIENFELVRNAGHHSFGVLVGSPEEATLAGQAATFLYLPGEVSRQADVLEAARQTGKPIFLERGAFLSPRDCLLALNKLEGSDVTIVDAGSHFGYGDRVLDVRAFSLYQKANCKTAMEISSLIRPEGTPYSYDPGWNHDEGFEEIFLQVAQALNVQNIVFRSHGAGATQLARLRAFVENHGGAR